MKRYITVTLSLLISAFILVQCTGTKQTTATAPTSETMVKAAQKRWPNATTEMIAAGETIYKTRCTKCHGDKGIINYSEAQWIPIIDKMAPKAKLLLMKKKH